MKVQATTTVTTPGGCWRLVKNIDKGYDDPLVKPSRPGGYVVMCRGSGRDQAAHRAIYEKWIGPIPAGLTLDHLCRNTACVNPCHMEPVTLSENARRAPIWSSKKTHCKRGHAFDEANTLIETGKTGKPNRRCRECHNAGQRRRWHLSAGMVRPRAVN